MCKTTSGRHNCKADHWLTFPAGSRAVIWFGRKSARTSNKSTPTFPSTHQSRGTLSTPQPSPGNDINRISTTDRIPPVASAASNLSGTPLGKHEHTNKMGARSRKNLLRDDHQLFANIIWRESFVLASGIFYSLYSMFCFPSVFVLLMSFLKNINMFFCLSRLILQPSNQKTQGFLLRDF